MVTIVLNFRRPADNKYQYAAQATEFVESLVRESCSNLRTLSSAGRLSLDFSQPPR